MDLQHQLNIDWKYIHGRTKLNDINPILYQCPKCNIKLSRIMYNIDKSWITIGLICKQCQYKWLEKKN